MWFGMMMPFWLSREKTKQREIPAEVDVFVFHQFSRSSQSSAHSTSKSTHMQTHTHRASNFCKGFMVMPVFSLLKYWKICAASNSVCLCLCACFGVWVCAFVHPSLILESEECKWCVWETCIETSTHTQTQFLPSSWVPRWEICSLVHRQTHG